MPLDNSGSDNTKMQLNSEPVKIPRSLLNDVQKYIDEVYVESIPEESDDGDYKRMAFAGQQLASKGVP